MSRDSLLLYVSLEREPLRQSAPQEASSLDKKMQGFGAFVLLDQLPFESLYWAKRGNVKQLQLGKSVRAPDCRSYGLAAVT